MKEFTPNLLLHNNVYPPSRVDGLIWCRPMQMLYHLENQSLELNCCFSWTLISAACSQFYKQCHLLLDACGHFDGHLLGLTHDSSDCRPGALESVTCRAVYVSVEGLCHIYKRHLRFSHSESSSFYVLVYLSFLSMKHLKLITCHTNIWQKVSGCQNRSRTFHLALVLWVADVVLVFLVKF